MAGGAPNGTEGKLGACAQPRATPARVPRPRLRQYPGVPSQPGQSAVVVLVPAAEPLVSGWRERYDPSATEGMPAHVTLLYPFLDDSCLDDSVVAQLGGLCADQPTLTLTFRRLGRFPELLYLDPEPAEGLRGITAALAQRWPEAPPYGGSFDEVIPHLTVAQGPDEQILAGIEHDLAARLPLRTAVEEAWLYVFDGAWWQPRLRLPFRSPGSSYRNERS